VTKRTKGPALTEEHIVQLPAGQKLDNLIAQAFMGWTRDSTGLWKKRSRNTGYADHGRGSSGLEEWRPSTNLLHAFVVLEHVKQRGGIAHLSTERQGRKKWSAMVGIHKYPGSSFHVWADREADTAPLAVCHAVLVALSRRVG
jgi:hypothetical protein